MRRRLWIAAQVVFAAVVIWYAADALAGQWDQVGTRLRRARPLWGYVVTASLMMLATYALLIEAWRYVLGSWSGTLSRADAARVWLASNLGKYVPGKVWSILAMGALARARGTSALAAGGAALLMQLVSVATGIALGAALGARSAGTQWPVVVAGAALLVVLVALPHLVRPAFKLARSLTGRDLNAPPVGTVTIIVAAIATTIAWVTSGVAFRLIAESLGISGGSTLGYISVYAASYVAGFVALFAPGGIGVREGALIASMERTGLASAPDAALLAVASRIWLTVLEVVPGLIALASARRVPATADTTDVTHTS